MANLFRTPGSLELRASRRTAVGLAALGLASIGSAALGPATLDLPIAAGPAYAAGGGGGSSGSNVAPADPNYTKARALIEDTEYAEAIPLLEKVVAARPDSADAYNYLGYSHRKIGEYEAALDAYQRALKLQPRHLGANEYLGELYLELGQLGKAEERLAVLDDACFFGCREYSELKERIADYKKRQGAG